MSDEKYSRSVECTDGSVMRDHLHSIDDVLNKMRDQGFAGITPDEVFNDDELNSRVNAEKELILKGATAFLKALERRPSVAAEIFVDIKRYYRDHDVDKWLVCTVSTIERLAETVDKLQLTTDNRVVDLVKHHPAFKVTRNNLIRNIVGEEAFKETGVDINADDFDMLIRTNVLEILQSTANRWDEIHDMLEDHQ
jgi:hypothetical protein